MFTLCTVACKRLDSEWLQPGSSLCSAWGGGEGIGEESKRESGITREERGGKRKREKGWEEEEGKRDGGREGHGGGGAKG